MLENMRKNHVKKAVLYTTLLIGMVGFSGCSLSFYTSSLSHPYSHPGASSVQQKIEKIDLDNHELTLGLNNDAKLTAYVLPDNSIDVDFVWQSDNTNIAQVSFDGTVTAVGVGETYVSVYTTDFEFSDRCHVVVKEKEIESIKINPKEISLAPGASQTLTYEASPVDATDKSVEWISNNPKVISVDQNGKVSARESAINGDTAIIMARSIANPEISDTCIVSVIQKEVNQYSQMKPGYTYDDLSKYNTYDLSSVPSVGEVNLLVIPVWFRDSQTKTGLTTSTREIVRDDIEKAYFGTNSQIGWRSVKSFYEEESTFDGKQQLTINGTVSEWYECGKGASTYYSSSDGNTNSLVSSATNWYFSTHNESRTDYDANKDGYIDGVVLIYAYPDYATEYNGSHENMWAYCYWLQGGNASVKNPNPNAYFWASYDFMYGSNTKIGKYAGGYTPYSNLDTHTFIHEMGHLFGLSDYYDYSRQYNPAGGFSMQDCNVGGHDPYSVFALGWSEPYVPVGNCTIELKPFQDSHELILLTPEMNQWKSPFDEYILLEYYTPTGLNEFDNKYKYGGSYPSGSSSKGIRIWHIDARLASWTRVNWDYTPVFEASTLTSNVKAYKEAGVVHAFSNTFYKSSSDDSYPYISVLGKSYANYNLLQLVRNNKTASYKNKNDFKTDDLFKAGSSFDLETYKTQFVNGAKLNNGKNLGYEVNIKNITDEAATIEIISQ